MKKLFTLLFAISLVFSFDSMYTKAFMAFKKGIKYKSTNPQKAQKYFQNAFVLLSQIKSNSSQKYYLLGRLYCNGWGVPQDLEKAEVYFKKALKLGNQKVYCCLARLYIRKGDFNKARKFLNYALSHKNLSSYCKDIDPKTLKINKNIVIK